MKRRSTARKTTAAIIAVLLCVLLSKLLGESFWQIVVYFVLGLLGGDVIAEFMEKRGWLGRKR